MKETHIYWTFGGQFSSLVSQFNVQVNRLRTTGFAVDVTATLAGLRFSSSDFGCFTLATDQCYGSVSCDPVSSLGMILVLGALNSSSSDFIGSDHKGVPLSTDQQQHLLKDCLKKQSEYDRLLLQGICGLLTPSVVRDCITTANVEQDQHKFVLF